MKREDRHANANGRIQMRNDLRESINDVVVKYLERKLQTEEPVDAANMAHEMAQSIVDMIMEQEERHQAPLLASTIASLGDEYLQRRGLVQTGRPEH